MNRSNIVNRQKITNRANTTNNETPKVYDAIKTFSAIDLHRRPATVFRAADREGMVKINHGQYHDKIFILKAVDRHANFND